MLRALGQLMLSLYAELDAQVAEFQQASGLACPDGCGACCHSNEVEATVLELLPLAFALFASTEAELLILRLESADSRSRCLLFHQNPDEPLLGRCTAYPWRAAICRLFGFAGNRNREGVPILAACKVMRQAMPASFENAVGQVQTMPLFLDVATRIAAVDPQLGTRRMPINQALLAALTKVGLLAALQEEEGFAVEDADDRPPDAPPRAKSAFPSRRAA